MYSYRDVNAVADETTKSWFFTKQDGITIKYLWMIVFWVAWIARIIFNLFNEIDDGLSKFSVVEGEDLVDQFTGSQVWFTEDCNEVLSDFQLNGMAEILNFLSGSWVIIQGFGGLIQQFTETLDNIDPETNLKHGRL